MKGCEDEIYFLFLLGKKGHSQPHWNMVLSCAYQSTVHVLGTFYFFFSFKMLVEVKARVNSVAFESVLSSCGLFARTTRMSPWREVSFHMHVVTIVRFKDLS